MNAAIMVSEKRPVPPVRGGAVQTLVYNLAHMMPKTVSVAVFSPFDPAQAECTLNIQAVRSSPLDRLCERLIHSENRLAGLLRLPAKTYRVARYARRCAAKMNGAYDVIHVFNDPNFISFIRRRNPRTPLILHMENRHLTSPRYTRFLLNRYRRAVSQCQMVVGCSEFIAQDILAQYDLTEETVRPIHNGIDTDVFKPQPPERNRRTRCAYGLPETSPLILFSGRLVPAKGVDLLLAALSALKERQWHLVIAGAPFFSDSAPETRYEKTLRELADPLRDRVHFVGHLDRPDVALLNAAADIAVVPSTWEEPFGLVVCEAMAAGTAVVASDRGAIPEQITHGMDGLLFSPSSPETLRRCLADLLDSSELRETLARRAVSTVAERFTIQKMAREVAALYEELGRERLR